MNMTPADVKRVFLERVELGSADLETIAKSFSSLYEDFQGEVVDEVSSEQVPGTPYTWIDPKSGRSESAVLFFHGGGYTMGSTADHLQLIASLVAQSGVTVLGVDYRLCPAHRFPSPLDDGEAAYRWLMEQGYAADKIGLAGLSAGALLVTQLVFRCQKSQLPMPAVAVVMSGLLDFDFQGASFQYNADRDIVGADRLKNIVKYYLPEPGEFDKNELYPARQHYEKYPRTLFQAGDHEVLLDDNVAFYEALRRQGHEVALQVVPGLVHCGQMFCKAFRPGQVAIDQAARFFGESFARCEMPCSG